MKSPIFLIRTGKAAGKLMSAGDWFRRPGDPGQVYRFHGHARTPAGNEAIDCYGGDKDPKGGRAWRSFYVSESFVPCSAPQAPSKKERVKT